MDGCVNTDADLKWQALHQCLIYTNAAIRRTMCPPVLDENSYTILELSQRWGLELSMVCMWAGIQIAVTMYVYTSKSFNTAYIWCNVERWSRPQRALSIIRENDLHVGSLYDFDGLCPTSTRINNNLFNMRVWETRVVCTHFYITKSMYDVQLVKGKKRNTSTLVLHVNQILTTKKNMKRATMFEPESNCSISTSLNWKPVRLVVWRGLENSIGSCVRCVRRETRFTYRIHFFFERGNHVNIKWLFSLH